ncbi:MAG TPA: NYN domain-containing protein [Alphaproteobacteria bacterium]
MTWYKDEKLAVFIDGANLYGAARSLEFDIDYKRMLQWAAKQGKLIRAYYYTALVEENEFSPIRPLVDWLDYNGYTMVTKLAREFTDASGRRKIKGNIDVELTTDVMEISNSVDHVMLFTGDGDFKYMVQAIQRKGVRVSVVSTVETHPPMISDELRRVADHFIDLSDLRNEIKRADAPNRAHNNSETTVTGGQN